MGIIWSLIIGALAGWLAGVIVRGYGFGLIGNLVVGVLGALVGDWLFGTLGWGSGTGMTFIGALVGAIILLVVIGFFSRPVKM